MRITNNMVLRNSLSGLQTNQAAVQKLQAQIASGVTISTASDDPTAASQVMGASSSLGAIDQYKRNIDSATARSASEESALNQINDLMTRAKELAVSAGSDTMTPEGRKTSSAEMEQIVQSAVAIGNTQFGGEYIFGGDNSTAAPFATTGTGATLNFTSTSPSGTRSVQISAGQNLVPTHDGQQAFVDSGIFASLRDMSVAMNSGSQSAVTSSMPSLDTAFTGLQQLIGESGARTNSLQVATQNLSALKINLTTYKSSLQEIDIESAVTQLVQKQTSYQAAMMATSKVLGMTLADYLK
jgi:flagellar hook-associated protein 3 FlgL